MLSGSGRTHMLRAPWMAIWPGVAISLAVFGFNMLGDALRDVLDPRLRGRVAGRRSLVYHRPRVPRPIDRRAATPADGARCRAWMACALASAALLGPAAAGGATFRVDPEQTRLAVRLYREGVGSALAHDHVVEATEIGGSVEYDAARPEASAIVIEVRTTSLRVDEPAARRRLGLEGDLSDSQRADVDKAMRAPDQLDVARHPTIRFVSTRVLAEGEGRLRVTGRLTLRGVTQEVTFPATVALDSGVLRGRATLTFLQSSFGYRPYRRPSRRDPEQGRGHAPRRPRGNPLKESGMKRAAR